MSYNKSNFINSCITYAINTTEMDLKWINKVQEDDGYIVYTTYTITNNKVIHNTLTKYMIKLPMIFPHTYPSVHGD